MTALSTEVSALINNRWHNDDARWKAVEQRDASADGQFVYAVLTTGVYCRPSCPSRQAKRENVRFYADGADAEEQGFRPCKRCRPGHQSRHQEQLQLVARACRMIDEAESSPSLEQVAADVGLSPHHFHRVFKAITGVTPRAYAQGSQDQRVQQELADGRSVTDAVYEAGFASSSPFYARAVRVLGMTPSEYRSGGTHADICFAVGECSLGSILVAATLKGLCAVLLGEEPEALIHELEDRFSRARLVPGDSEFEQLVARVIRYVEQPVGRPQLPLDVRGTVFQRRVWQALRELPFGSTASYRDIAERIGSSASSRAVANACGANALAVLVPCHRVVRKDGSMGGYRWGIDRKKRLLERESAAAAG